MNMIYNYQLEDIIAEVEKDWDENQSGRWSDYHLIKVMEVAEKACLLGQKSIADLERQIVIVWDIDDVKSRRKDLTDEQAMDVLNHVKRSHDANEGVHWLTLECAADHLFPEKEERHLSDGIRELRNQLIEATNEHGRNHVELWWDEDSDEFYARYYDESGGEARGEITDRLSGEDIGIDDASDLANELGIFQCL
jgi:hypothetical protein